MKLLKILVVSSLCISILFNLFLFDKIDNLENKINAFSNTQHQFSSTINAQISQISNTIDELEKEQEWLSHMNLEVKVDQTNKKKGLVIFEWQVKQFQNEAEIYLNYKRSDESKYKSVSAVEKGNGFFNVEIPIEIDPEPIWNYYIVDKISDFSREQSIEEIKKEFKSENRLSYNYYVTVKNNGTTKNSEIDNTYVENIGALNYGYLEIHAIIDENNNYNVSLSNGKIYDADIYLQDVYLEKYRDSKLIENEKLERISIMQEDKAGSNAVAEFQTKYSDEEFNYSKLSIKVVYSDGSVFEREIYSE